MLSENWVKYMRSCQMQHNFRCSDDLYKLGKECLNSLTYKFYSFTGQNLENIDIQHAFLPLTVFSTLKNSPVYCGPPCTTELEWILNGRLWRSITPSASSSFFRLLCASVVLNLNRICNSLSIHLVQPAGTATMGTTWVYSPNLQKRHLEVTQASDSLTDFYRFRDMPKSRIVIFIPALPIVWLDGRVVRTLDLQSVGREFESWPLRYRVQPWASMLTHMCLCHQAVWFGGVALAMRHRQFLRAHGFRKGDEHPA